MNKKILVNESLAVRMRPDTFDGIIGQRQAVAILKGMINKNPPGAILITGEPGLGKTTLARVFSRYLNCKTYSACGKCPSCKQSIEVHPDITEINMGAERGIDVVRNVSTHAKYCPQYNTRVFICDEVHNLTEPAQQAFLKIIEEPPSKSLFILCTSNPEKMTKAMLRRCTKIHLTHASVEELGVKLVEIAGKEGVNLNTKSGKKMCTSIAHSCNGEIGLAISILENYLFAMAGEGGTEPSEIFKKVFSKNQSSVELAAVSCCIAFVRLYTKSVCKHVFSVDNCRQLIMKMRLVAMAILQDYAGTIKYNAYAFKEFKKRLAKANIEYNSKTLAPKILKLLTCLNSIELKMIQGSGINEQALFLSELCSLVATMKEEAKESE